MLPAFCRYCLKLILLENHYLADFQEAEAEEPQTLLRTLKNLPLTGEEFQNKVNDNQEIINKSNLGMTSIEGFAEAAKKAVELAK